MPDLPPPLGPDDDGPPTRVVLSARQRLVLRRALEYLGEGLSPHAVIEIGGEWIGKGELDRLAALVAEPEPRG